MIYTLNGHEVTREEWLAGAPGFTPGCPPVISGTDNDFWRGNWEDKDTAVYRKMTERAGFSTTGKTYISQMADYPGDPKAWVSDQHDIKKFCEEGGHGCKGMVKVKKDGREDEPRESGPGLGEDIVEAKVEKILEKEPEKRRKKQQIKDEVRSRHTPGWAKGK